MKSGVFAGPRAMHAHHDLREDSRRNPERAGLFHVTVSHACGIERSRRMTFAVEKNQAAGRVHAMREFADASVGHSLREPAAPRGIRILAMRRERLLALQKIRRHFRHHDFHDAFAVAGAGNAARFGIGVTTAADQRRIADASREVCSKCPR